MECYTKVEPSKTLTSGDWKFPNDVLVLLKSFGYECLRRSNLHCLERNLLAFITGCFVEMMNVETREIKFIRSTSGGGIGSIAVHPSRKFLAVAEKGTFPSIIIHDYPSLMARHWLRGGTERLYSHVAFSIDGNLLASVGGDPDYTLTIWDWRAESTLLRSKAYSQEVFKVSFSSLQEGVITTVGTGHIKFWKMANTFTGLKLQGRVGKFQKKEISDIEGYAELPGGKVLTGCEWGNLLLWEGALIKVELSRKNGRRCHVGPIQQIIFQGDRILTLGLDGYVRVWDFEIVDGADAANETDLVEMEPINELSIGEGVQLKSAVLAPPSNDEEENINIWYAQDSAGGIWRLDLSFSEPMIPPEMLFICHSGPVAALCTSPLAGDPKVASIGVDCTVRLYDYDADQLKCMSRFNQPGTALLWLPEEVDKTGSLMVAGFEDGVIRLLALKSSEESKHESVLDQNGQSDPLKSSPESPHLAQFLGTELKLMLVQVAKPHRGRVVSVDVDPLGTILATGSKDGTIFFFALNDATDLEKAEFLQPIGFVRTPSPVTFLKWSPRTHSQCTLLVCCEQGQVLEVEPPDRLQVDTGSSYQLDSVKIRHRTIKTSGLKGEGKENPKAKISRKESSFKGDRLRQQDDGDDDADSSSLQKNPKTKAPSRPPDVLCGLHSSFEGRYWITMDGEDSGRLFEMTFGEEVGETTPSNKCRTLDLSLPSDELACPIKCFIYDERNQCFVYGRSDGTICILPMAGPETFDRSRCFGIHDSTCGQINSITLSRCGKYLFTAGMDGNIFKLEYNSDGRQERAEKSKEERGKVDERTGVELNFSNGKDISDPKALCIEDSRKKSEYDSWMREVEKRRAERRMAVEEMRKEFAELKLLDKKLPERLRLHPAEFEMDPAIGKDLARQRQRKLDKIRSELNCLGSKFQNDLDLVYNRYLKPMECDLIILKDFGGRYHICSYRFSKLSDNFLATKARLVKEQHLTKHHGSDGVTDTISTISACAVGGARDSPIEIPVVKVNIAGSKGERLTKALNKVREVKIKKNDRALEWKRLLDEKPDPERSDPEDDRAIEEARRSIGDYKLKTSTDYVVPDHLKTTLSTALARVISVYEKIHEKKQEFNKKLLALRQRKIIIIDIIESRVETLNEIIVKLGRAQRNGDVEESKDKAGRDLSGSVVDKEPSKRAVSKDAHSDVPPGTARCVPVDESLEDVLVVPTLEPCEMPESKFNLVWNSTKDSTPRHDAKTEEKMAEEFEEDPKLERNDLEVFREKAKTIELAHQKDETVAEIRRLKNFFDAELVLLRNLKFAADVMLANAESRLMTLLQEMDIVKNFENKERELTGILEKKLREKRRLKDKVTVVKRKLDLKKTEVEAFQERMRELSEEFTKEFSGHDFFDFLLKVFKMKVKKLKKKMLRDKSNEERLSSSSGSKPSMKWKSSSSSSSSNFSSDSDSSSYVNNSSLDPRLCPPDCSQDAYDRACEMRDKRLGVREALLESKAARDRYFHDVGELKEKLDVLEGSSKTAGKDLEVFQLEKQKKLNEIDVIVTLTFVQIEAMDKDGTLNDDLSSDLVIPRSEIQKLKNKILELKKEKDEIKRLQTDAKKKTQRLLKERKSFVELIDTTKKACDQLTVDKFGKLVDIETLEKITINPQVEEAKYQLNCMENDHLFEMDFIERKIRDRKTALAILKRENAKLLDQYNEACKDSLELEKLPSAQQFESKEQKLAYLSRKDEEEIEQLEKVVRAQSKEIRDAKREVLMFTLKTGHLDQK